MHTINPAYRSATFSLKWGVLECERLNGMVVRKRRHNSLEVMLSLRNQHADRLRARMVGEIYRTPGTLRKRWKQWHGHKTMMIRHASRGIPKPST